MAGAAAVNRPDDVGPSCGVTIAERAAQVLESFPEEQIHVLFMLKNGKSQEPATPEDAAQFDDDAGWGTRGKTLVDADLEGRATYFGGDEVGTMILAPGFVIRAINEHDFAKVLPGILEE